MKPFRSIGQFIVFLVFAFMGILCLIGAFYNPFHIMTTGMCAGMAGVAYNEW